MRSLLRDWRRWSLTERVATIVIVGILAIGAVDLMFTAAPIADALSHAEF
jgi:hypothetical protein